MSFQVEFHETLNNDVGTISEKVVIKDDIETYENTPLHVTETSVNEHISCLLHDYALCRDSVISKHLNKEVQTENSVPVKTFHDASSQTIIETREISAQTNTVACESKSIQVEKPNWCLRT